MAITVKKITLWRGEFANQPGELGKVLRPLAAAGADLQIVMGYHYQGGGEKAAIEVYPVTGKKTKTAAENAGLKDSSIPTLLVQGDNRAGLGSAIANACRCGHQHRLPGGPSDWRAVLRGDWFCRR